MAAYENIPAEGTEVALTAEQAAQRAGLSPSYFKNQMAVLNRTGRDLRTPRTERGPRKYDLDRLNQWITEGMPISAGDDPEPGAQAVEATAVHEGGRWKVTVAGGSTSFARTLDVGRRDAQMIAAEQLSVGPEQIDIHLTVTMPDDAAALWEKAKQQQKTAKEAAQATAQLTRQAVAALKAGGYTYQDIGHTLGISHQRAQQLARDHRQGRYTGEQDA